MYGRTSARQPSFLARPQAQLSCNGRTGWFRDIQPVHPTAQNARLQRLRESDRTLLDIVPKDDLIHVVHHFRKQTLVFANVRLEKLARLLDQARQYRPAKLVEFVECDQQSRVLAVNTRRRAMLSPTHQIFDRHEPAARHPRHPPRSRMLAQRRRVEDPIKQETHRFDKLAPDFAPECPRQRLLLAVTIRDLLCRGQDAQLEVFHEAQILAGPFSRGD